MARAGKVGACAVTGAGETAEAGGSGGGEERPAPRFTAIIPTYQRRELAVAAVEALAQQRCAFPFEVIVVVDGSTDGTAAALRNLEIPFPLRILEQPNRGAASARNRGAS